MLLRWIQNNDLNRMFRRKSSTDHFPLLLLSFVYLIGCSSYQENGEINTQHAIHLDSQADQNTEFARQELLKIFLDRPNMASYPIEGDKYRILTEEDTIFQYALARFAGPGLLNQVSWGGVPPIEAPTILAAHKSPTQTATGIVYIRSTYPKGPKSGQRLPFERLWRSLIFELFNMENEASFKELTRRATVNEINKDTWMLGVLKLEHTAILKTIDFYKTTWKSWASQNQFTNNSSFWNINTPASFDRLLPVYLESDSGMQHWKYLEGQYDSKIADRVELYRLIREGPVQEESKTIP